MAEKIFPSASTNYVGRISRGASGSSLFTTNKLTYTRVYTVCVSFWATFTNCQWCCIWCLQNNCRTQEINGMFVANMLCRLLALRDTLCWQSSYWEFWRIFCGRKLSWFTKKNKNILSQSVLLWNKIKMSTMTKARISKCGWSVPFFICFIHTNHKDYRILLKYN